ncbi:alpha/beta hydrolase (plasmid) [Cupriavidus basilensis]
MGNRLQRIAVYLTTLLLAACVQWSSMGVHLPPPAPPPPPTPSYMQDIGEVPLDDHARAQKEAFVYPVSFGTTRKPTVAGGTAFSNQRDATLHYGTVSVNVPTNHRTGSLGSWLGTVTNLDPELTVRDIRLARSEAEFLARASAELATVTGPENNYILVFIHGYNNSFTDAALRAAQLGVDLGVPSNNMFLFSWAANSDTLKYTHDEATIDASEVHLRAFLNTVSRVASGRKIHIIAHSMGNRALLRVIAASVANAPDERQTRFGQIILAAADVDRDVFAQNAQNYLRVADRTTIYLSPYDYAVEASSLVHKYPRVGRGEKPQVTIPGIDSVVSKIKVDFPAHAYFAETRPILTDVKNLILRNQPAREGNGWQKVDDYWVVSDK